MNAYQITKFSSSFYDWLVLAMRCKSVIIEYKSYFPCISKKIKGTIVCDIITAIRHFCFAFFFIFVIESSHYIAMSLVFTGKHIIYYIDCKKNTTNS